MKLGKVFDQIKLKKVPEEGTSNLKAKLFKIEIKLKFSVFKIIL